MPDRARTLVNETDRLVSLPAVYFEVRRIVDRPDSDIIDVAKAIATDVALTARLLRIVNSPIYAQARPVETVTRAVSLLGINQVHDLCLAASLANTFAKVEPRQMDVARFWRDSLLRATAARSLAHDCRLVDRERLFVLGLLADVGHMVMYLRIPEEMNGLRTALHGESEPLHRLERRLLGCDYAQVGGALLRHWRLAEGVCLPVEQQTAPGPGQERAGESALLNIVAGAVEARNRGGDLAAFTTPAAWRMTGLAPEQVADALPASEASMAAMAGGLFGDGRLAA